jgi:hypothetical protein
MKSCPHLKARANFAGLNARSGNVINATKKHTAEPMRHAPKPSSLAQSYVHQPPHMSERQSSMTHLSHRESAKYASCSLLVSPERSGMYALAPPIALANRPNGPGAGAAGAAGASLAPPRAQRNCERFWRKDCSLAISIGFPSANGVCSKCEAEETETGETRRRWWRADVSAGPGFRLRDLAQTTLAAHSLICTHSTTMSKGGSATALRRLMTEYKQLTSQGASLNPPRGYRLK